MRRISLCIFLVLAMEGFGLSQDEQYRLPPEAVVDVIDAAPEPAVMVSPDRNWMLFVHRDAMPSIADVSRRMLKLAGMRIDPAANGPFQTSFNKSLEIRKLEGGETTKIPLPSGAKISTVSWSHQSNAVAIVAVTESGSELWLAKTSSPGQPQLLTKNLSTVMGGLDWFPDGNKILCKTVPDGRGEEPTESLVPAGPRIQESAGNKSPTRTYQDLLQNPHDEALFEHYATNQLTLVDFSGEKVAVKKIADPQIYAGSEVSPDGKHLLVTTIQKPFSYLMTAGSFPRKIEIWDVSGKMEYQVADVPMAENIPIEGVRLGRRNITWMSGRDASLVWNEALDGGDPNKEAEFRDVYMSIAAPFEGEPDELAKTNHRAYQMSYMANPNHVISLQYDRDRRWITSLIHNLSAPEESPKVAVDRSIRDRYGDPGRMVTRTDESGHSIAWMDGSYGYRIGTGASPKGDLPFIDRQNMESMETERLWRCEEGTLEFVAGIVKSSEDTKPTILTRRESDTAPPNYFLRDLEKGTEKALTEFKDPTPQIRGITKELVKYKRADGVPLSANLYLPADYKKGTRLPLIVWAYPREFNDAKTAGQVSGSNDSFTRIRGLSHLTFLTQGYAIMDAATMPVIGDPETMNDTFIEQIVGAAKAAIDKAVEMGVADRDRVGVGGHSYGAFMTANLLAHCDLFKAGIARSGAYNRTLTPFGFQSERRSLWDAKSIYYGISPFLHANTINEPVLLIHGEDDNNSGTFPLQSKRMYQAIKGNGGTVRLVMLPNESHGYRARESVLHTQAEMIEWFDKYVKNANITSH